MREYAISSAEWKPLSKMLQVIIPLAGRAHAFADKGYTFPKPLIELGGKSMIEIVIENLRVPQPARFHFVCRKEHLQQFYLSDVLRLLAPDSQIIACESDTAGALCSALLAVDQIDPEGELLIANADQIIEAPLEPYYRMCREPLLDGCILTFSAIHPRWSYARISSEGRVVEVAEKKPISRSATAGVYYFRRAQTFFRSAEQLLLKGLRTQEQFFVCPVYNEMILDGKTIGTYHLPDGSMHSLGTPEDVEHYQARLRQTAH